MAKRTGFVVKQEISRPSPDLVELYKGFETANISDSMDRLFTMHYSVKPAYSPMRKIAGAAVTVQARPGDNLLGLKAIEVAQPGDVIVISGFENDALSVWGGFMSMMAAKKGIAGVVTDGLVRDVKQTRLVDFPVYAKGVTPAAPTKEASGQINTTISCGRVIVEPGDLIVADEDGVVVIPLAETNSLLTRIHARIEKEAAWEKIVAAGGTVAIESASETIARLGGTIE